MVDMNGPTTLPSRELAALVARTEGLQPWRRIFHAVSGLALAFVPAALALDPPVTVALLGAAVAFLLAADLARLRVPALNRLFFRAFTSLASPREARQIASSTWFALGGLITYLLFPYAVATAALVVLALADPAASVVGRTWGRRRLGKGSLEGAGTFFVVAFVALSPLVGAGPALAAALVSAAVEVLPIPLDDNLTIPLTCGAAVAWLLGIPA
jgi:dolichol kinase